jgi:DHA1 family tetracycline resistance protein-like MFS transporter
MNQRPAATVFIFAAVVMDVLAMGIIIPVLPALVVQMMGGDTVKAAVIYGAFGTAWALMQFLCSPVIGAISDRFGRRRVLLISCFGLGLDYLFMAMAPTLAWLFVGRVISGITASSFSTAGAYIADVTPPEKRAAAFGMIGAAFGIGFVIGPVLGGVLGHTDPRLPFWVAGALALANAAYGYFVLPESLPAERRAAFNWKKANPVGSLQLLRSQPGLSGLASVYFLFQLAHYVLPSVCVLYATYRYGWDARAMGFMLAGVGVANIIVQALLIKPVVARIGERSAMIMGLCFGVAGFAGMGLAPNATWFVATVPIFSLMGFFGPGAQALMTRRVSPQEQGRLQGVNSSLMGIAGLFGPFLFTLSFAHFIAIDRSWTLPGAPFLIAACLLALAAFIGSRTARPLPAASHA